MDNILSEWCLQHNYFGSVSMETVVSSDGKWIAHCFKKEE